MEKEEVHKSPTWLSGISWHSTLDNTANVLTTGHAKKEKGRSTAVLRRAIQAMYTGQLFNLSLSKTDLYSTHITTQSFVSNVSSVG